MSRLMICKLVVISLMLHVAGCCVLVLTIAVVVIAWNRR